MKCKGKKLLGIVVSLSILTSSISAFAEEIAGREYINSPSEWKGNQLNDGLLQTNIYPGAVPYIKRVGNTNVVVWLSDNRNRNSVNRTELVFSVQTEEGGVWTAPVGIDADGTADFYPSIAGDGQKLFVVWQNINKAFSDTEASLGKMAQASDIKVAEFDITSKKFKAAVALTTNDVLDKTPVVSVSNNKAQVTWIRNDMNDLLDYTGKNSVMLSEFDGSSWSTPIEAIKNAGKIVTMSAVGQEGKQYLAYSLDVDSNYNTLEDREIYYAKLGNQGGIVPTKLTTNNVVDAKPIIIARNNKVSVVWYSGNKIAVIEDVASPVQKDFLTGSTSGFSDNFKVIYNDNNISLLWLKEKDGNVEGYAALYDEYTGEMSNIVKVTKTQDRIIALDGIYNSKGELVIVCNKAEKVAKTEGTNTYYVNGLSDLFITKVLWEINGTIDQNSVYWNEDEFCPGKPMTISFNLVNTGTVTIRNVIFEAYDGSPDNGGKKLSDTKVLTEYIKAGETEKVDFSFSPTEARRYDVYLKAIVDYGNDVDQSDNIAIIDTGYCDVQISSMYMAGSETVRNIMLTILNDSYVVAKDVKLIVTEDSNTGKILYEKIYSKLEKGKSKQEVIMLDTSEMVFTNGIKKICARLETQSEEYYLTNNKNYANIIKEDSVIPFEVLITETQNTGKVITVETAIGNNYTATIKGNLQLDLYDGNTNKLMTSKKHAVEVAPQIFKYHTETFNNDSGYSGKYYVIAKVTRITDSGIPNSFVEISNVQTANIKGNSVQEPTPTDPTTGTPTDPSTGTPVDPTPTDPITGGGAVIPILPELSSIATLSKLSFNQGDLTPTFNKNKLEYKLAIDENLQEIAITADVEDEKAEMIIQDVIVEDQVKNYVLKLSDKQEKITIKVNAEDESTKTYVVKLVRSININVPDTPGKVISVTDIDGHWAKDNIITLIQMGILSGYSDNTFKPNNKITRAEAAVLLVKLFNVKPIEGQKLSFKDEKQIPKWAYSYIKAAADQGWIKGYTDSTFKASNSITRQEFAVMFVKAMNQKDIKVQATTFKDDSKISAWAKGYVVRAVELSLISGYAGNTFKGQGNITRAEAATISKKYLDGKK